MSDEKPDPLSDVIRGLGLILRAAKTTVERVPTKGLEEVVLDTAREVGRAIENVATVVEREVRGRRDRDRDSSPESRGRRPDEGHDGRDDEGNDGGDEPRSSDTPRPPRSDEPPKPPPAA
jgi:hypothetical protein